MKYILALMIAMFASTAVYAEAETKRVCIKQKDAKTGKERDVCRTIKVHKKLEGTKIPEKK